MPHTPRNSDRLEDWAYPLAERLARRYIGGWPDSATSVDDLVQIMIEHWWLKRTKFTTDGPAVLETVAYRVMSNRLRDEYEKAVAQKRGSRFSTVSINEVLFDEDGDAGEERAERVAGDEDTVEEAEGALRHQAIEAFRRSLSPADRELLDYFGDDPRVRPVAHRLGVHHSQVYRPLDRIRQLAEDAGLRDWL